jgi:hypothetical protein
LVYYESGRKLFVLAYDLLSSISYVVAGGAWLLRAQIRLPEDAELKVAAGTGPNGSLPRGLLNVRYMPSLHNGFRRGSYAYERLMNPFGTRCKAGHIADTTKPLRK